MLLTHSNYKNTDCFHWMSYLNENFLSLNKYFTILSQSFDKPTFNHRGLPCISAIMKGENRKMKCKYPVKLRHSIEHILTSQVDLKSYRNATNCQNKDIFQFLGYGGNVNREVLSLFQQRHIQDTIKIFLAIVFQNL